LAGRLSAILIYFYSNFLRGRNLLLSICHCESALRVYPKQSEHFPRMKRFRALSLANPSMAERNFRVCFGFTSNRFVSRNDSFFLKTAYFSGSPLKKQGNKLPSREGRGDRRGNLNKGEVSPFALLMTEGIFGDFIKMFKNCHCE